MVRADKPADSPAKSSVETKVETEKPFNFDEATKGLFKPKEIWKYVDKDRVPPEFTIVSDQIVPSDTDSSKKLRRVDAYFHSIKIDGKIWKNKCVILMPVDYEKTVKPEDKGKVAIVGTGGPDYPLHTQKIADPIATRLGFPVMILANPGEYLDGTELEGEIRVLDKVRQETGKNYYNMNCQLAVVYVQAMDVFQKFLGLDTLKAVVGGHSKRGRSATVAAAFDSRVASPVIVGNEGVYRTDMVQSHLHFHHAFFQDQVKVPVLYIGATNEGGYKAFNVNLLQERLKTPMTVEMVTNYPHAFQNEIQFMTFIMWVAHIHHDRPITKIGEVEHTRKGRRSVFRVKIDTESKIQVVKAWYVYSDDAQWRDLMWYHLIMNPVGGGYYEAVFHGKLPDAVMIEVGDIAQGVPGYVSGVPKKLTDAPVEERIPGDWRSRLWTPE